MGKKLGLRLWLALGLVFGHPAFGFDKLIVTCANLFRLEARWIAIQDPHHHLNGEIATLLSRSLAQERYADRLLFVAKSLFLESRKAIVTVGYHHNTITYEDDHDRHPKPPVTIVFAEPHLSEHPDMAIPGIIDELFLQQLKKSYDTEWESLINSELLRLQANGFGHWDPGVLRESIEHAICYRTTWRDKATYYRETIAKEPEIRSPFYEHLTANIDDTDRIIREEIPEFYMLNPGVVSAVWQTPLPPSWNAALITPPFKGGR